MKRIDVALCMIGFFALGALTACEKTMYEPSHLTPSRMHAEETQFFDQQPIAAVNAGYIARTAHDYQRAARGPLEVTVTFDPVSRSNTAMNASLAAGRIKKQFDEVGLHNVTAGILPIREQGADSQVMISYANYTAKPPAGCAGLLTGTGTEDAGLDPSEKYKMGCTVEAYMARQMQPKDLAGQGADNVSDGRRGAVIVDKYHTGAPNEDLGGESASGSK